VIAIESSRAVSRNSGVTGSKDGGFHDVMINKDGDGIEAIS